MNFRAKTAFRVKCRDKMAELGKNSKFDLLLAAECRQIYFTDIGRFEVI